VIGKSFPDYVRFPLILVGDESRDVVLTQVKTNETSGRGFLVGPRFFLGIVFGSSRFIGNQKAVQVLFHAVGKNLRLPVTVVLILEDREFGGGVCQAK
jgi:hypothetical protein